VIDSNAHSITVQGKPVHLTPRNSTCCSTLPATPGKSSPIALCSPQSGARSRRISPNTCASLSASCARNSKPRRQAVHPDRALGRLPVHPRRLERKRGVNSAGPSESTGRLLDHPSMNSGPRDRRPLARIGRALIEVAFIIFSTTQIFDWENSRYSGHGKLCLRRQRYFHGHDFSIGMISALIGFAVFHSLRNGYRNVIRNLISLHFI